MATKRKKKVSYWDRVEYAREIFAEVFTTLKDYPVYVALRKFGTTRDKELLNLAYEMCCNAFVNGYTTAQHYDEQIKRAYSTTDQVQE